MSIPEGKLQWLQLRLRTGPHSAEELENAFEAAGAIAVTFEDAQDHPILEPAPGETPLWKQTLVTGLFDAGVTELESAQTALCSALGTGHLPLLEHDLLQERAWTRAWMDHFEPMRFGRRLWICPTHREPPSESEVTVKLDPGLAFGSGTHPTTALCLEWLDGADLEDATVIDYGCGSGILGIAAAALGAQQVWCADIDAQAILAARRNAARNGVDSKLHACRPEELPAVASQALVANILAGPLMALAPHLATLVAPGGFIVLSGLLSPQADEVETHFSRWVEFGPRSVRDDWVMLQGERLPLVR